MLDSRWPPFDQLRTLPSSFSDLTATDCPRPTISFVPWMQVPTTGSRYPSRSRPDHPIAPSSVTTIALTRSSCPGRFEAPIRQRFSAPERASRATTSRMNSSWGLPRSSSAATHDSDSANGRPTFPVVPPTECEAPSGSAQTKIPLPPAGEIAANTRRLALDRRVLPG